MVFMSISLFPRRPEFQTALWTEHGYYLPSSKSSRCACRCQAQCGMSRHSSGQVNRVPVLMELT